MNSPTLEVKRNRGVSCEVVGYTFKKATDTPSVHKNYGGHKALLAQLKKSGELSAGSGALCFVRFKGRYGGKHVLFVNLGENATGIDALRMTERLRRLGALASQKLEAEKAASALVLADSFMLDEEEGDLETLSQALMEGLLLATYRFKKYFTKKDAGSLQKICVAVKDAKAMARLKRAAETALIIADATNMVRDLGNEPSNELTPEALAKAAQTVGKDHGMKVTVWDEKKLKAENMNLLLAVGKGSVHPPRLIVMEYAPANAKAHLALVGKGLTFDSGGISIKPSARMEDMKHDMCGAAAVIGAGAAIAALKLPVKLTVVVATAENMPDAGALKPGDIVKSRNGKTVEINNTDAEGRLVLADALDYTQDLKPDYIVNAATLTGAVNIALGKYCAGLMGNSDELNLAICEASDYSGERVWELPMYREYFDDLRSSYADMKNVGDAPGAGTIRGGQFLLQFIKGKQKWAHIDLAYTASDHGVVPYNPRKGASGWGVRLFVDLARLVAAEREQA